MNEDREITLEVLKSMKERNLLIDKLLKVFVIVILSITISFSWVIYIMVDKYFTSDYPVYPEFEQTIEQTMEGNDIK